MINQTQNMKKLFIVATLFFSFQIQSQNNKLASYAQEIIRDVNNNISNITFKAGYQPSELDIAEFINSMVLNNSSNKVSVFKSEKDQLGFTHIKYNINQNGVKIFNKMIIAHAKDGKLISLNGDLSEVKTPLTKFTINENAALNYALKKINAKTYKWEIKEEEAAMAKSFNDPNFTYYPKATKVLFEKEGKLYSAYQFNIYAHEPLYRANVFVDASTGKVLAEQNLICTVDVPGSAATKYSGTQTLTIDQNGGSYRLRETARGNGIETYNLQNTANYGASVDFTNAATSWTAVNVDQGARDAHWGAEKTYDYYWNIHNINSIDNAGFKLLSYVHYNTNYNNAFWDGTRMTYGDGNGVVFTILTSLDVCGHEVTHGLVTNTGGLNGGGTGEPDALNEAFADIFGTSIERYAKPVTWEWKIGADITPSGNGLRNMSNPNLFNDPDTYNGTYWDPAGEPHNNAGPCDYWFYLLVAGGTGTNDIANSFTVNGIGNSDAERIAFRALTVYFTPSTNYAAARAACIQSAKDLFGSCSNQVIQTTNAWYAVGVGSAYVPGAIGPNFNSSNNIGICSLPYSVNFNNTTQNGLSYTWYFGDGATATSTNASHSYTANGTYNVKLKATGCIAGVDSITQSAYVVINAPSNPTTTGAAICVGGTMNLTATGGGNLNWYTVPGSTVVINTGNSYTTPNLVNTTTYYVVNSTTNAAAFGGILTNTAVGTSGGNVNNPAQYLIFDVTQSGTLQTVVIYAPAASSRTIQLRNAGNTVLNSTVVSLVTGANTVTLNFNLTPGSNYQLGLSAGSTGNLFRTNSGVAYPYNVAGVVNITNSSAGTGFYYWFYNWKVRKADCTSNPIPVTAVVNAAPSLFATGASTSVCHEAGLTALIGTPAGGTFSGPGVTGTNFDSSVGIGTYTITYNYTDGNGCSGSTNFEMSVTECTGIKTQNVAASEILIFPNPAQSFVMVKNAATAKVIVTDATGRLILDQTLNSNEEKLNTTSIAKGIYFMTIQNESGKSIKTLKFVIN